MNRTLTLEKIASATLRLKDEYDELQKVAQAQEYKLQKRAQAEDILMKARNNPNAPINLRPSTLEDFFQKRAQLEENSDQHLEKVALMLDYMSNTQDFLLDDEEEVEKKDFNSFLRELNTEI